METIINISDHDFHNAMNSAIAKELKNINIQEIAKQVIENKLSNLVRKGISDGSFVGMVANKIASEIPISEIVELIDVEKLNTIAADRVSKHLISKVLNNK